MPKWKSPIELGTRSSVVVMEMLEMSANICFKVYILHESKGVLFSFSGRNCAGAASMW